MYTAYLTYMQSTSHEMPGWMKHKLESRLLGEIPITSDMPDDTTLMPENKEELKSLLMKVIEENEDSDLKLGIQKAKIMASHNFMANRWGNNGNSDRCYFLGSKIIADGDCSHEIKRCLLLGRKVMTNLVQFSSVQSLSHV